MSYKFQFDSLQAFIEMGGHGLYIWMCYLFVLATWSYLAIAPSLQTKAFFKQQIQRQKRLDPSNVDNFNLDSINRDSSKKEEQ